MAPPLAGIVRQPMGAFLLYDVLGSLIWCGSAVALGYVFRDAVDDVLRTLVHFGGIGGAAIAGALFLYVAYKWLQRYTLIRTLRMDRITGEELQDLIKNGVAPVIIDARPKEVQTELGLSIPGALSVFLIRSKRLLNSSTRRQKSLCIAPALTRFQRRRSLWR